MTNTSTDPVAQQVHELGATAYNAVRDLLAGTEGLPTLRELRDLSALIDQGIAQNAAALRQVGATWAEIGSALGISRQAAQQRFG